MDARGITASVAYDALNPPLLVTYDHTTSTDRLVPARDGGFAWSELPIVWDVDTPMGLERLHGLGKFQQPPHQAVHFK